MNGPRITQFRGDVLTPGATTKIETLYRRLYTFYGPQRWWPASADASAGRPAGALAAEGRSVDPAWEMMVGAILTQNTAWTNVEKALAELKNARALSINTIAAMPRPRLEKLIRSSGFFRQKAERLRRFARWLRDEPEIYKELSRGISNSEFGVRSSEEGVLHKKNLLPHSAFRTPHSNKLSFLRRLLLSQNGIGPETADSILLYAGGYPIFVVDAYTRRIGRRVGFLRTDDYHEVQAVFEKALTGIPEKERSHVYNEFHALLVRLAKYVCTKRAPLCAECPLKAGCMYARDFKTSSRRSVGRDP
jgi:endonuclease-3 related protein